MSVETLLKNSDLTPELLLQALLPLTSDNGPLTLHEGQGFPYRGRSSGGWAVPLLLGGGALMVGVWQGMNGVPFAATHLSLPSSGADWE